MSQLQKQLKNSFADVIENAGKTEYGTILKFVERPLYFAAMEYVGGNQAKAANLMGVARGTLRAKLKEYFGTTLVGGTYNYRPKEFVNKKEKTKTISTNTLLFNSKIKEDLDEKCRV